MYYGIGSDNPRTASINGIAADSLMEATKNHQATRTKIPPVMEYHTRYQHPAPKWKKDGEKENGPR